jgi:mannose-6-phosphate isomerase-like protein (cupin superfamily)
MRIITSGTTSNFQGATDGPASISLILSQPEPGTGPRVHRHPYDETWVVERGELRFEVGDEQGRATAGDIVVAPPEIPHRFTNCGAGTARVICIHASPTVIGEFLE